GTQAQQYPAKCCVHFADCTATAAIQIWQPLLYRRLLVAAIMLVAIGTEMRGREGGSHEWAQIRCRRPRVGDWPSAAAVQRRSCWSTACLHVCTLRSAAKRVADVGVRPGTDAVEPRRESSQQGQRRPAHFEMENADPDAREPGCAPDVD